MISYELMNLKIKTGEALVIKVNERQAESGKYIKTVDLHGDYFKLCPEADCLFYQPLGNFTRGHAMCKTCRNKNESLKYYTDINTHLRARRASINRGVSRDKKCSKDEFELFFKTARCQFTGRTLQDEFKNPSSNPAFKLEIDHKVPLSKGGSSKPDNLQVVPRWYNALKKDLNPSELRETLNYIAGIYRKG